MKIKILSCIPALVCLLAASANPAFAQSTAFTYQGRLDLNANPANGLYDLTFSLFNASSGPGQVGSTYPTPNTAVSNGLFTVVLDFGANFPGANRWLEIAVRTNGTVTFTTLAPRQPLTATPYAIQAANAGLAANVSPGAVTSAGIQDATITATKVASGQVVKSLNGLFDAVTLSAGANVTLTTNGSSLQLSSSGGATSGWALGGNGGTTSANFLGSTDNQPLELRVNGARALRLEPNTSGAPNVVGGSSVNFAVAGVKGAVIGGGGATNYSGVPYTNSVAADFSTVSGGFANSIQANAGTSTIGGGFLNTIQPSASTSTIGGGYVNTIGTNAFNSTIGGGSGNVVQPNASSGTIGGGGNNVIQPNAVVSTIGGGLNNSNLANAAYATIPGGSLNAVGGSYGFAAGHRAKALHPGAFVWADSTVADFSSAATNEFAIRAAGGVRVSDTTPGFFFGSTTRQMLNLFQTDYGIGVQDFTVYQRSGGGFAWYLGGTHTNAQNNPGGGTKLMTLDSSGNLTAAGVGSFDGGTSDYGIVVTGGFFGGVHGVAANGYGVKGETTSGIGVWGASSGTGDGLHGSSTSGIGVYGSGGAWAGYFAGAVSVCSLQIRGGCDVAEPFQMSHQEIPKGSVVVIDDENAGQLKLSDRAYDSRVAGIVSGANGIKPGLSLSQEGVLEGGQNVALSGRVYVLADASNGAIKPGDLLTTSSTPGHAMRVKNNAKAQGAILGKAMGSLKEGKGMVLVLVTLQ